MREDRLDTFALLGVGALLGAVAIAIVVPPANRYELSIYEAYPGMFWILVVGAIFTGSLVIVRSAGISEDRSWVYGLAIVLLTNALLLLLPYIRGYQMFGRGDALSHIGFVQDILSGGGIEANIYPPLHLLVIAISGATGTTPMHIAMGVPVVFSGIYFGGLFYLLVTLFDSRNRLLVALPFILLPVLKQAHLGLRPFDVGTMLVPLVLYLFIAGQRSPKPSLRAAFVVALTGLVLYHPLTAIFLVIVFSLYFISRYVPLVVETHASPTNLVSLSAVLFLAWYSNFSGIIRRFDKIYTVLLGSGEGTPPLKVYTSTVKEASPALVDLVRVATFKFGVEFVLFGLGFACLGLVGYYGLQDEYIHDRVTTTFLATLCLFSIGGLVFLFTDLIVPHDRPFQMAKLTAVVLAGYLFYLLSNRTNLIGYRSEYFPGVGAPLATILLVLVVLSTFSLYLSPLASGTNHQVTEMELEGADWLVEHENGANQLLQFGMNYRRFYHAKYGVSAPEPSGGTPPPPHFNYTVYESLGQSFDSDKYMIISRRGRIVYPGVFPDYPDRWRFTPGDYEHLEYDASTSRVYDNGDANQYLVRALES